MKNRKNVTNISQYRFKKSFSIGLLLILIVFLYLCIVVVGYLTEKKVSIYEVRSGSIVRDDVYTGLIIRQEQVVSTDQPGYVNFYMTDASKVRCGQKVCALSPQRASENEVKQPPDHEKDPAQDIKISAKTRQYSFSKIHSYNEAYQPQNYKNLAALKDELTGLLQSSDGSSSAQDTHTANIPEGSRVVQSPADGVISTYVDGLEHVTLDNFTADQVKKKNYKEKRVENDAYIETNEAAYKLVTSEDWHVVIPLSEGLAESLRDKTSVRIHMMKDNAQMIGDFSILEKDGISFGIISFDHSMVRYVQDRYVRLELIVDNETGLKIPKSSVEKKQFFAIPRDYLTTGGNSAAYGVIVQTSGSDTTNGEFHKLRLFAEDSAKQCVYVSTDDFPEGTVIIKPESSVTYTLREEVTLSGVYNVNQGYAVFRYVDILSENDEYYIVSEDSVYGISNYDRIAQNAESVKENEVIAK